jgi:hypothetical protein
MSPKINFIINIRPLSQEFRGWHETENQAKMNILRVFDIGMLHWMAPKNYVPYALMLLEFILYKLGL